MTKKLYRFDVPYVERGVGYFYVEAESQNEAWLLVRRGKAEYDDRDDDNTSLEYFFSEAELTDIEEESYYEVSS